MWLSASLFLISLHLTGAFLNRQNIIYSKVSVAGLTRSRWLISMVLELSPYNEFLSKLSNDIQRAYALLDSVMEKFDTPRSPEYKLALERLGREINSLKLSHINLEAKFSSYKMLSPRKRRSLLPSMTPVLHLLFGTLSSADVGALRRNVARLAKNQADITHVLEESLSVINASRISIDRNRQTINDIIDSLTDMDVKFANITEALQLNLIELSQFIRLYVQLDLVVEELKRFSFKGLFLLDHFKAQLGFFSLSRLSTEIIDPFQLTNILKGIAMRLSPTLKLPYDPE
ncbi:MAG: hypothetical protein JAY75_07100, partial [Candidatus Thiodiazotropha taylori]|nr:hypothetical protein [Candidatus Thiodiazotropha taylori]MCW4307978.1 hypothetical protein [Candidatus Thiodiazotropha endolucinida]